MITHEAIGAHLPGGFLASLLQGLQEPQPVLVIVEDGLTAISTVHDVINGSR
jgi:hypothetical protein